MVVPTDYARRAVARAVTRRMGDGYTVTRSGVSGPRLDLAWPGEQRAAGREGAVDVAEEILNSCYDTARARWSRRRKVRRAAAARITYPNIGAGAGGD